MKSFAILALFSAVQSVRFIDSYDEVLSSVDIDTSGVDIQAMMQQ